MRLKRYPQSSGKRIGMFLAVVGMVAAPAALGLQAGSSVTADEPQSVSLAKMKVEEGQPVPLAVLTDEHRSKLFDKGFRGQGIDVALIDSGVSPVAGLDQPGKVTYGPDLSNEGGLPNLANLDTYGHGTHLAGIIAGDDGDEVGGIAVNSRIVSVKVAGATGETNVAQVIAGIDWVIEHRYDNGLNIRVLNLSLGVDGVTTNQGDPLSAAVERAWHAGIVVIVAAGNRGNDANGLDSPAISPYVIAVGATESYDSKGKKDKIASWSSGGTENRQPDVVAPGRSIMSFRVPGSMLDQLHPEAVVDDKYFVGSGTSQSAAVVSGFTAAVLSVDPMLTPDQVKFLFQENAKDIDKHGFLDGAGRIVAKDTAGKTKDKDKAGKQHHRHAVPETSSMGVADVAGASWSGGAWNGASWSGGTWSGASWSGASWSGASWSGGLWSGASWSGASWSDASWSGASWSGASWSGASWSGASWSGADWAGSEWEVVSS